MFESELIIPKLDNDGHSLDALRDSIALAMSDAFGGVTMRDSNGAWRDSNGKLYREPVTELISACEPDAKSDATLRSLADRILTEGHQKAAYVKFPDSHVEIVEPHPVALAA